MKTIAVIVVTLALLLSGGALAAPADDAEAAFKRGDYALSLQIVQPLAEAGDPKAQCLLAAHYLTGYGVAKDVAEAIAWYTRAADQGSLEGMRGVGLAYLGATDEATRDYVKAREWFERADAAGDIQSTVVLGALHGFGWGGPVDNTKAAALFRKGADAGDPGAQRSLGQLYYGGKGVAEDHAEAARLFALAAEQNDRDSQYNLAIMLAEGDHVERDLVEAAKWALLAMTQGSTDAEALIAKLKNILTDEQKNGANARATEWLGAYRAKHPG